MKTQILLRNRLVEVPDTMGVSTEDTTAELGTILGNLAYYGYIVSKDLYETLSDMTAEQLGLWYAGLATALKAEAGPVEAMQEHVVYKNFPDEVMNMDEGQYWCRQVLMYLGVDKGYFTQPEQDRAALDLSSLDLAVLQAANAKSLQGILRETAGMQAGWNEDQFETVAYLVFQEGLPLDLAEVPFKENMAKIMGSAINLGAQLEARNATDVLRVATAMSDGDVSFATSSKFRRFTRKERRGILGMLEKCKNLEEDARRHAERFKRLLHGLHPSDYSRQFPRVMELQKSIYNGRKVETFNNKVEEGLYSLDVSVLDLLQQRPGEFARRLRHCTELFGEQAVHAFLACADRLSTQQLLSLRKVAETWNDRQYSMFPPKGNWSKVQINENNRSWQFADVLATGINTIVQFRMEGEYINVLDERLKNVKLPDGADLMPYGRGTRLDIPDGITFLRSASYWRLGKGVAAHNVWYDNGWNFFDEDWNAKGAISWDNPKYGKAAAFSGDPCSSKTKDGQATQVIDLYLDRLAAQGIRYAVWNVLCFSNRPFDLSQEVIGGLQWGDDARKGKLFEPSRNVMQFPIKGMGLTKYIAMVDIEARQIVYLDANLPGRVNSAGANCETLEKSMPAFMEYLDAQPSVYDLFENAPMDPGTEGIVAVYRDDKPVDGKAYVFQSTNEESDFEQIELTEFLNSKASTKILSGK